MHHFLAVDFGTGTTLAVFHILGNFPVANERVNSFARGEAILLAVDFSIWADIPSRPLALFVSTLLMR